MRVSSRVAVFSAAFLACAPVARAQPATPPPHNVILFVADGLRSGMVDQQTAPTMARLRRDGVDFRNSHAIYPTVTTANASTLATGHYLGDTGNFGNSIFVGHPLPALNGSKTAALENDAVLADMNALFPGGYVNETTVLAAARAAGYSTAAVGKLGPVAIQDITDRSGATVILDDRTGREDGVPLSPAVAKAMQAAGFESEAPGRGPNTEAGDATTAGTLTPNFGQERWFTDAVIKVLLPRFKAAGKPFAMVYWSRDPDGTQHNQGDSLLTLTPGINGKTSLAAIRNADDQLARLLAALKAQSLDRSTDVIVTADHGFSTISKQSRTSPSARLRYPDVPRGLLPPGFLGVDLGIMLKLPVAEGETGVPIDYRKGRHPRFGDVLLGDPARPQVVVSPNGGSDLIYLPGGDAPALARRILDALWTQDYTAAVFVDDSLGPLPGALPLSAIGFEGSALTPRPAIVVSYRSWSTGCADPELCAVEVADTYLQQGQGIHGTLSRADTHNFMAAIGPDFKTGFVDPAPASNADLGRTLLGLLRLEVTPKGRLRGRLLSEALTGGAPVQVTRATVRAYPTASGFAPVLKLQRVGDAAYFDAAGVVGRAVGLDARPNPDTSSARSTRRRGGVRPRPAP